jgi:hypothetical protein
VNHYFNTPAIYSQSPSSISREEGFIKGITLCQVGEAKGHNLHLDDNFITELVNLGNQNSKGVKARFGHPNICSTALGTYLGRYKNFRKEGNKAIADLYLDQSARTSPKGNLYDYVFDLAENNPDMFGASIAFKAGKSFKKLATENNKEVEKEYATIQLLYAADLVDNPAATDGLFSAFYEDDFASQVTIFLDEHPQVYELLDSKPEILNEFLKNYKQYKKDKQMNLNDELTKLRQWVTDNFTKNPPRSEVDAKALKTEFEDKLLALEKISTDEEVKHLESLLEEKTSSNVELAEKVDRLTNQLSELQSELNKLKASPTLPDKQADPSLSLKPKQTKDNSGKILLSNLPRNTRRQLQTT